MKVPEIENFFSRLQRAAGLRGSSLTELSAQTGVALSTMYRWKESAPHTRTLKQIAEKLGVSESWLRDGKGEMEAYANLTQEEVTPYKFTQRSPAFQPTQATELHAACQVMLNMMTHATTPQAFGYAVLGFEETWQKFKTAKYDALNQTPP